MSNQPRRTPPVGSVLTPQQRSLHDQGLAASAYLFAHVQVPVWIQSRLSPSGTAHERGIENLHKQDTMDTLNRGLCLLHLHLASLMVSTRGSALTLQDLGRSISPTFASILTGRGSPLRPITPCSALGGIESDLGHRATQSQHPHGGDSRLHRSSARLRLTPHHRTSSESARIYSLTHLPCLARWRQSAPSVAQALTISTCEFSLWSPPLGSRTMQTPRPSVTRLRERRACFLTQTYSWTSLRHVRGGSNDHVPSSLAASFSSPKACDCSSP